MENKVDMCLLWWVLQNTWPIKLQECLANLVGKVILGNKLFVRIKSKNSPSLSRAEMFSEWILRYRSSEISNVLLYGNINIIIILIIIISSSSLIIIISSSSNSSSSSSGGGGGGGIGGGDCGVGSQTEDNQYTYYFRSTKVQKDLYVVAINFFYIKLLKELQKYLFFFCRYVWFSGNRYAFPGCYTSECCGIIIIMAIIATISCHRSWKMW